MAVPRQQSICIGDVENEKVVDDRALNAGRGIFYSFSAMLRGIVVLPQSIRGISVSDQTNLVHLILENCYNKQSQTIKLTNGSYTIGNVTKAAVEVMLNISSEGMLVAPPGYKGGDNDKVGVLSFVPMKLVSLAASGSGEFKTCLVYVGKDATSKIREAFVFDLTGNIDDAVSVIQQAFTLATMKPPSVPDEPAVTAITMEHTYQNVDDAKAEEGVDDLAREMSKVLKESPRGSSVSEKLINTFNSLAITDKIANLQKTDAEDQQRPTWVYFKPSTERIKLDVSKFLREQSTPP